MNFIEQSYGLPIVDLQNLSELIRLHKVDRFHKLAEAIPLEKYLKMNLTEDEKKELRFAPKVEAVKFKDPQGENFTGFRNVFKNGVLIFALLPGNLLPICAEFRHGCERVMLNLPSGLIEPNDINPEAAARREFEEETGIALQKIIPLNLKGIPVDARSSTRQNFFFLGVPTNPFEIRESKMQKAEFIASFLIHVDNWLKLMESGMVDGCSVSGTLLALKKLNLLSPIRFS